MNKEILTEVALIKTELDSGRYIIAVIANGIAACTRISSLSCKDGQRYISALYLIFDTLSGMSGKLREQLDRAYDFQT